MKYDFDTVIERKGSGDVMHEALQKMWGRDDLLPMWVADMDFPVLPEIVEALHQRLEHPIFGYTVSPEDYWETIIQWIKDHHQWNVKAEWMRFIPGIVKGIGLVTNVFSNPGDKVIILPPVYHPFRITPQGNGRQVVFSPLKLKDDGYYEIDFDNLEQVCDEQCKILILSNPHNPAGVVWPQETLVRLADFCYAHHLLVISDEIHCDMALFGHKHIPFASVSDHAREISITFQAPTKTFNIAGIVSSYCIVPNAEIRRKFFTWLDANEFSAMHIFAPIATMAAYRYGEDWRKQMLHYVEGNIKFVEDYCREHMPQIRPLRPQASFLIWLNCRDLHLSHEQLIHLFVDEAHLALNDGEMFGQGGQGFMRLNIAMPRKIVEQGMRQLAEAVKKL
ncbi:MAG: pyridoxal phosphate-dependent aminotransferase [Prevotella sp.]|jgi:cystathionine beta-lyase|nr:pyridoxal phosphate-dependent aminotransferase [Prevotella sp.]MCI1281215.1 pyridoxal phosphate-dependent aminotransferase [Prevotella sp.]